MASPQKENGFTPIANEILDELVMLRIPASEKDVLMFVIRKTYGYHKKEDKISITQFELGTGLSRPTVVMALKNLVSRNILNRSIKLYYKFNKNYECWVVNTPLLVKYSNTTSKLTLTKTSKDTLTHKRKKITKDNTAKAELLKKNMKTFNYDTGEYEEEVKKIHKNKEAIRLAKMFDEMASEYSEKPIVTPKSYFIVINALNKHEMTSKGIEQLYYDWFLDKKKKLEEKVNLSFALSAGNINAFKAKH